MKNISLTLFFAFVLISCNQPQVKKDTEFINGSKINSIELSEQKIENLKALGLIWGYLKYYHPEVSAGNYNWDFELFRIMPAVLEAKNINERNDLLLRWVKRFDENFKQTDVESGSADIKLKPDLAWMENSQFSNELMSKLSALKSVKRKRKNYYVTLQANVKNPDFKNEAAYQEMKYPDAGYRLLSLFRYWNIIQYYFPYKNLIEEDWEDVLFEFIPKFINVKNETEYQLTVLELIARVHDTHANFWNDKLYEYWGVNYAPVGIKFIEDKAIVSNYLDEKLAEKTGLMFGDEIIKVNGTSVSDIISSQLKYTPASNYSTQLRNISRRLLRTNDTVINVEFVRNDELQMKDINTYSSDIIDVYKSNQDTCFKILDGEIAYLYLGLLRKKYLPEIFEKVENTKGLVIDLRCYPLEFVVFKLSKYLLPNKTDFVRFSNGSIVTPGQFEFTECLKVGQENEDYYKGKVVILINEVTQSQAEYTVMALKKAPNATVLGSTTAGADGNISFFYLPGGIKTAISGIGVYYPDKTETQRIGIIPDVELIPTIEGIKNGKDELLEKAIEIIQN